MSYTTVLITILPVLLGWKFYSYVKRRSAYDLHKVPAPPGWPLLGNIGQLYRSDHMHRVCLTPDSVKLAVKDSAHCTDHTR